MKGLWHKSLMGVGLSCGLLLAGEGVVADNLAKNDFVNYCASCHGADGKGKGPMAGALKGKPTDLTMLTKNNNGYFPYLKLRRVIDGQVEDGNIRAHSSHEMPVWGNVFRSELGVTDGREGGNYAIAKARILHIVDYISSIQQ